MTRTARSSTTVRTSPAFTGRLAAVTPRGTGTLGGRGLGGGGGGGGCFGGCGFGGGGCAFLCCRRRRGPPIRPLSLPLAALALRAWRTLAALFRGTAGPPYLK